MHRSPALVACICILSCFIYTNTFAEEPTPKLDGIDLSHFNGEVDWEKLTVNNSALKFVVIKATEGVDYLDPTFQKNWLAARKAGITRGAYHFFIAHDDPEQEANWFIRNVTLDKGDLFPIVDVERAKKKNTPHLRQRLEHFLHRIEEHYNVPPIVYTGPKFWNMHIRGKVHEGRLWIAQYEVDTPTIPKGWDTWSFWQYTQKGKVVGVEKAVDMNYFSGSIKDLELLQVKTR